MTKLFADANISHSQSQEIIKEVRKNLGLKSSKKKKEIIKKTQPDKIGNVFSTPNLDTQIDQFFKKLGQPKVAVKNDKRKQLIQAAEKQLGVQYVYGGNSPKNGFDCSGFTQYIFAQKGISINRTTRSQAKAGKKIVTEKANVGDLVFFSQDGKKISHVGIVTSKPSKTLTMIHASSSKGVIHTNIMKSSYWRKRLMFVRRVV